MKRLLVFVFVVVLLGSCSRKSKVHYELEVLHNTNMIELELFYNGLDNQNRCIIRGNGAASAHETPIPFAVGNSYNLMAYNRKLFPTNSIINPNSSQWKLKKGTHISIYLNAVCDSTVVNSNLDSIHCDFAVSIEVFVDNNLHEEFNLWNFEKEMIDFTVT